ncbi:MAG: hypothetical protein Q9M29_03985 [Mariprofundaceae bacterium]|nr:hypothetical protein [Mariprofundaceae bacterium]
MNTPAHAIVNLLLFRKTHREAHAVAIVAGALMPDAPMFVFYLWAKFGGAPERSIWRDGYFDAGWQTIFDTFHSFPLLGLAWLAAWRTRMNALTVFFASMFVHSLFDFPLHHNDAHRHFLPLSDFRLTSPVSYWNPVYHGQIVGAAELLVVVAGGAWLLKTTHTPALRNIVSAMLFIYVAFRGFAMAMWA